MARVWIGVHDFFGARLAILQNASDLDRAWTANDAGMGAFTLPMGDSQAQYVRAGLLYVIESDTGLPPWVGCKLPRTTVDEDGSRISVPLREIGALLMLQHTSATAAYVATAAGAVLRDVLGDLGASLPFTVGPMDDLGPSVDIEPRHVDLLTLARNLATDAGYQWWVQPRVTTGRITASVEWGARRGVDRSAEVVLEEGRNLAAFPRVSDPDHEHPAAYTAVGTTDGGTAYASRPLSTSTLESVAGTFRRSSYGQRVAAVVEDLSSSASAERYALRRLLELDPIRIEATVTDTALWPKCLIDNDVTIRLPSYGRGKGIAAKARIVGVQPDEAAGELDLLLEVA